MASHDILGFDYGLSQIGVAIGQELTRSASALTTLKARDGIPNWEQIQQLLDEWQPGLLLVGAPYNMDGSDSELLVRAKKFGNRLHGRFGLPVELVDERLTSFEAKQLAREQGHDGNYHKQPVDALAAQLIVESWFNQQP